MTEVSDVKVIKSENGPVRINASDYKPDEHELHLGDETHDEHGVRRVAPAAFVAAQIMQPPTETKIIDTGNGEGSGSTVPVRSYDTFGVMQNRNKFYIVDGAKEGKVVDDVEGIEPKGYPSNEEAWRVLLALKAGKTATDNA